MLLGMPPLTFFHTLLSIIALIAGAGAVATLMNGRRAEGWNVVYLVTGIGTSATGFMLPSAGFGASHWVGVLSLIVFAIALVARYRAALAGGWLRVYAVTAVFGLYFLAFVAVAQLFKKVPQLAAAAPTLSEPPFAIAQLVTLVLFVILLVAAVRRTRPALQMATLA
jgi:hypothetical protein